MSVTINGSGTITSSTGTLSLGADNLTTTGTIPAAQLTGTMPAINGAAITALNATNLGSGTVPTARLGTGTASSSTFLRGDGSWQAAGGGSLEFLGSTTAASTASISFTSLMSSNYDNYMFVFAGMRPATDGATLQMLLSTDNGSSFLSSSYAFVIPVVYYIGGSGNGGNTESQSTTHIQVSSAMGNDADAGFSGNIFLWNVNDSAKRTSMHAEWIGEEGTNVGAAGHSWGFHLTAATHNAIQFKFSTGNMEDGIVKMFGIKNS